MDLEFVTSMQRFGGNSELTMVAGRVAHPVLKGPSVVKELIIGWVSLWWCKRSNRVFVDLLLKPTEEDLKIWPHSFEYRLRVTLGPAGDLILTSRIRNTNTDGKPFTFTFAYHTYFSVSDIRRFVHRCGARQSGNLGSSEDALDGILGFGKSNSSIISQLASSGKVKKMFEHCLDGDNGGEKQELQRCKDAGNQRPAYPSFKPTKDWDKLEAQVKKEEKDEKLDGNAALNKFFRDIYKDTDDDTRRAMRISFVFIYQNRYSHIANFMWQVLCDQQGLADEAT
ncbi:unnamed protein product [Lactuca virosa]|uniref:SGS domain-containing protein n=1 Tax=Lactuca virosa TaxID=75947 RepID=A0AAU9PI02_9ASTR|nr:unnamed protein product [Lactuca virosa]